MAKNKKTLIKGSFTAKYQARPVRAERGDYMTQCEMVLDYMKKHGSITSRDAANDLHLYSLAARIKNLRDMGINIKAKTDTAKNIYGKTCVFSRYYFEQ